MDKKRCTKRVSSPIAAPKLYENSELTPSLASQPASQRAILDGHIISESAVSLPYISDRCAVGRSASPLSSACVDLGFLLSSTLSPTLSAYTQAVPSTSTSWLFSLSNPSSQPTAALPPSSFSSNQSLNSSRTTECARFGIATSAGSC
jgi:hypothetical protein